MNHCVPDFEIEEDDSIPTSSYPHKSSLSEEDLMEIIWRNGPVMNNQNQRSLKKFQPKSPINEAGESAVKIIQSAASASASTAVVSDEAQNHNLFMQEDEMASLLHYPLDDSFERDFCADLLYHAPSSNFSHVSRITQIPDDRRPEEKLPASAQPPIQPAKRTELDPSSKLHNFMHFSRPKTRFESQPCISDKTAKELTVVDSSETPAVWSERRVSNGETSAGPVSGGNMGCGSMDVDAVAEQDRDLGNCELTVTSSSDGSGASGSACAEPSAKPPINYRKRKARETDDLDCQDEVQKDAKFEPADTKKQVHGSTSARRTRAAEVHNLSERRRRDRINEKMKALQELIPRCNKSDKASMLDEAIEYLKSLQLQVQHMMSMGCNMVPMMFPGVQQYMSPMGMGMGMGMRMGMGMGMDMGLSRPMLRFPSVLPGSSMARPATASHFSPRLPIPAFHVPPASSVDPSAIHATNQSDPTFSSNGVRCPSPLQVPNFADPYQHYLGLHHLQVPPCPPQNQVVAQPSTSKGVDSLEHHKPS